MKNGRFGFEHVLYCTRFAQEYFHWHITRVYSLLLWLGLGASDRPDLCLSLSLSLSLSFPSLSFPLSVNAFLQLKKPEWAPDFGPAEFVPSWGATATGARNFLIAYNVNLLGTTEQAQRIARLIREQGKPTEVRGGREGGREGGGRGRREGERERGREGGRREGGGRGREGGRERSVYNEDVVVETWEGGAVQVDLHREYWRKVLIFDIQN